MTRSGSGEARNGPQRRDTGLYITFGLVLTTTHDCNLRCRYCYAGRKSPRPMPPAVAFRAVDRALASVAPGGTLELGFFGGEPLLEADLIERVISYAAPAAFRRDVDPRFSMTTNGTLTGPKAWSLMAWPAMSLAVSHDGLPEVHNRYRRRTDGTGSSAAVLRTIRRLLDAGRDPAVVMVVRPDTCSTCPPASSSSTGSELRVSSPTSTSGPNGPPTTSAGSKRPSMSVQTSGATHSPASGAEPLPGPGSS